MESRTQGSRPRTQKNPRPKPRTAFSRTDTLEAKGQGHKRKCSPKKKKGLQKNFSSDLHKGQGLDLRGQGLQNLSSRTPPLLISNYFTMQLVSPEYCLLLFQEFSSHQILSKITWENCWLSQTSPDGTWSMMVLLVCCSLAIATKPVY